MTVLPGQNPFPDMEVCQLQLTGAPLNELTTAPKIDDRMRLEVEVECFGLGLKRMAKGELRLVASMRVIDFVIKSGPTTPTGEPDLFTNDEE